MLPQVSCPIMKLTYREQIDIKFSIVLWLVVEAAGSHRWLHPGSMPPGLSSLKGLTYP